VKGFALTLGLATLVDIGVLYFFTQPATYLMGRGPLGDGGSFSIRGAMGRMDDEEHDEVGTVRDDEPVASPEEVST
jgi:hypothetical protein